MRNFLTSLFLGLVAILLVLFFVANREPVVVSFDPTSLENPAFSFTQPLFVSLAGSLMVGFLLGAVGMWISNTRLRSRSSEARKRIRELERELAVTKAEVRSAPEAGKSNLPALRS